MTHQYAAFGLRIRSELQFPELLALPPGQAGNPDVTIRVAKVESALPPEPSATSWVQAGGGQDETLCTYEGVGRFLVRSGSEILVDAAPGVDPALVRHAIVGPVIAPLLWRRGLFTLHASVIDVGGRCVAFVAASGEGKSTVGAALYARGHRLVSDDLGAIDWQASPLRVRAGFPRLRVFPDTLRSLGDDPEQYPRVYADIDKRSKHAERFVSEASLLDRIFVLAPGERIESERLGAREAMVELMRHAYAASQLAPMVGLATHLRMAAKLAEQVPVFALRRPRELERLPELTAFVERQLGV